MIGKNKPNLPNSCNPIMR